MKHERSRDPYLYEDVPVLKNIPGVKSTEELKSLEGDLTKLSMGIVYAQNFSKFNAETLCQIHRIIFGGLYDWAGSFRTIHMVKPEEVLGGDSVRYAAPGEIKPRLDGAAKEIARLRVTDDPRDLMFRIVRITADLWHTHPFREGNTRAVVAFSVLLAEKFGIELDHKLFAQNAAYVRNALVWCTQGIYSRYEYLERIYFDAAGLSEPGPDTAPRKAKDYSALGDYRVENYREQPHLYVDGAE